MGFISYTNAKIYTGDKGRRFLGNGFVRIKDNTIQTLGDMQAYSIREGEQQIDLHGRLLMPSLISTHYHFYGQLIRGMPLKRPVNNWQRILKNLWWALDQKLDEEEIRACAMMGLMEGIPCGITAYFDHHASPALIDGSLDILGEAVQQAGVKAALSYEVTDRYGREKAKAGIRENERFIRKCQKERGNLRGLLGMHASYTLGDDTLSACAALVKQYACGVHVHVAEDAADVSDSYRKADRHPVERLAAYNLWNETSIAAHMVHVKAPEWNILKEYGVTVAHNPLSNANNGVGISPAAQMLREGVPVAIGGDGCTPDLLSEISMAIAGQRGIFKNPQLFSTEEAMALSVENPSRLFRKTFAFSAGVLKPGARADMLIFSYDPPTPVTEENVFAHILSAGSRAVDTVVADGRVVAKNGKCLTVDEEKAAFFCRQQAERLWRAMG